MNKGRSVKGLVEHALAFADVALDTMTPRILLAAKTHAEGVLPQVARMKPRAANLREAHQVLQMVTQLRAVMTLLERKLAGLDPEPELN